MAFTGKMRGAPWPQDGSSKDSVRRACMQCTVQCHEVHRVWSHDCFDACPKCSSACNSASDLPFFFKYVAMSMESTYYKPAMEVPFAFARAYISDSVCHVELEDPSSRLWIVKVKHEPTECILGQGWKDFSASHGLARGDALLFQLMSSDASKHRHFLVKIFKQAPLAIAPRRHAIPSTSLHPHKDKAPNIDMRCSGPLQAPIAEMEGGKEPNVSKPKSKGKNMELEAMNLREEDEKPVFDAECDGDMCAPHIDLIEKSTARDVETCTKKDKPSAEFPNEWRKNSDKEQDLMKLKAGEGCADLRVNASTASAQKRELILGLPMHVETSTKCVAGRNSSALNLIKGKELQIVLKHQTDDDKLAQVLQKKRISMSEANNCYDVSSTKSYVRRKTAIEATAKINRCFKLMSSSKNFSEPSFNYFQNTYTARKAAFHAMAKINNHNSIVVNENYVIRKQPKTMCEPQEAQAYWKLSHHFTFSKVMCASNVNLPYAVRIPQSFVKAFIRSEKPNTNVTMKFILKLEQTSANTALAGQRGDGQSWLAFCRPNASGSMVMTKGWKEFACTNELQVGDVCIFDLVKPMTFKIHIVPCGNSSDSECRKDFLAVARIAPSSSCDPPMQNHMP